MKRETSIKGSLLFAVGLLIGMLIVGFTKPTYMHIKRVSINRYLKVNDWKSETNPKKVKYLEHLYNK
jgi:uncharacterized membrane protein YciS (DUF1049 family)